MHSGEDFTAENLSRAQQAIGYEFCDMELLKECLTHKSYSNACGGADNERLEFLGDAVLGLCVTEDLYRASSSDEGVLTERRQQLVSQAALEQACERAGLMTFLRYSGGENNVGGKTASNLFEAVLGAIYLDGGLDAVRPFLKRYLVITGQRNYKTLLQEYVQERTKRTPEYHVIEEDGRYICTVSALDHSAQGAGESKKIAETQAAQKLYQILLKR